MSSWKVPLFKIYWDDEDIEYVAKVIKEGANWACGASIKQFEELLAQYVGAKYCVTFNSGTSALFAALLALDIREGDEVIVPSFTFIATANAPLFVRAKPVFADIEEETYGLDPEDVKERISNKTRAIIPVHYGGCPCKIRELKEVAEDYNLLLIEDAAEAFGAKVNDQKVGTFGDCAIFSFCQNKIITTGEGGAVVTDNKNLFEKLKLIRSHGRVEQAENYFYSAKPAEYVSLGFNFRLSSMAAALGISQLKKADKLIKMRRENANYLKLRLKELEDYIMPPEPPDGYYHVYQLFTIRAINRDGLMSYLANRGIMTRVYFHPVHLTYFFRNILRITCNLPVTEKVASQVLTLPMYPSLTKGDMDMIVEEIKNFYVRCF